jgi:hypothetical protein
VLSTAKVAIWVPALTDESTYVGHFKLEPAVDGADRPVSRLFDYPASGRSPQPPRLR